MLTVGSISSSYFFLPRRSQVPLPFVAGFSGYRLRIVTCVTWRVWSRTQVEAFAHFRVSPKALGNSWHWFYSGMLFAGSPGSPSPGPSSCTSAACRLTALMVFCVSLLATFRHKPFQLTLNDWVHGIFYPDEGWLFLRRWDEHTASFLPR